MRRRDFLKAGVGVSLGFLGSNAIGKVTDKNKKRPNIVLIMADDIGFEGISAYGSLSYKTPVLDRLAKEGMRFDYCFSQPICTPSRVEIMTGKYNFRNYTKFGQLDPKEITFANLLKDSGYETLVAGKWQLGGGAEKVAGFGFENHCLWHIEGRESRFWEPRIMIDGKVKTEEIKDRYGPDVICDYVTDFIKKPKSKPFFVYYPMTLVHPPYVPTPDSPEGGSRTREGHWGKGGEEYFDDMVAYMDKCIGRVVDTLEKQGLRDNTLLMFTGDNGCTTNIYSKMPKRT
ncbi:MAG: sulfatase-like hydrolase/transferase, partial [Planctomycetes bacterium]|nr:sulfatase-like hydrolase/transferase [Planctomycetota bacterium]